MRGSDGERVNGGAANGAAATCAPGHPRQSPRPSPASPAAEAARSRAQLRPRTPQSFPAPPPARGALRPRRRSTRSETGSARCACAPSPRVDRDGREARMELRRPPMSSFFSSSTSSATAYKVDASADAPPGKDGNGKGGRERLRRARGVGCLRLEPTVGTAEVPPDKVADSAPLKLVGNRGVLLYYGEITHGLRTNYVEIML